MSRKKLIMIFSGNIFRGDEDRGVQVFTIGTNTEVALRGGIATWGAWIIVESVVVVQEIEEYDGKKDKEEGS